MAYSSRYKRFGLRKKIFLGFLFICILSVFGSGLLSYFILKDHLDEENRTELQKNSEEIMGAFDYALSHKEMQTKDLQKTLGNKILEIADINKQDLIVFDLNGKFLLSNKDFKLVNKKEIAPKVIAELLKTGKRVDVQAYDSKKKANITSSYLLIKNNILQPIAVLYLPYYHSDSKYVDFFDKYLKYIVLVDLFIIRLDFLANFKKFNQCIDGFF